MFYISWLWIYLCQNKVIVQTLLRMMILSDLLEFIPDILAQNKAGKIYKLLMNKDRSNFACFSGPEFLYDTLHKEL